jgi:uncharacterized protein (DUF1778 family)
MAATERIPVQVTPDEKARIAKRAKSLGLTVSEFARRAMARLDRDAADPADLEALLERVKRSTAQANRAIGGALRFVAESEKRIRRLESGRGERRAA